MKFSFRQIIASAGGAVIAATIASLFGVKGTVIGVAIGSAAATFGTAFVSQSIERGHEAVKQVAVRVPARTALLRRMGGTATSGEADTTQIDATQPENTQPENTPTETTQPESAWPTEPVVASTSQSDDITAVHTTSLGADATIEMQAVPQAAEDPATEELALPVAGRAPRSIPWRAITATAVVVFVLSLGAVTVIELIAGHPLTDLFHHSTSNDPSVGQLFNNPPATTSTTTTTTTSTTTTSSSTTTSTTSPTSTTSTTGTGSTTTTTAPGQGTDHHRAQLVREHDHHDCGLSAPGRRRRAPKEV